MNAIGLPPNFFRLIVLIGFLMTFLATIAKDFNIANYQLINKTPGVSLLYLDLTSIETNGSHVRYRTVLNLENSLFPAQSSVNDVESDCNAKIIRTLEFRTYSAKYGQGKLIRATSPAEIPGGSNAFMSWSDAPESDDAAIVCKLVRH